MSSISRKYMSKRQRPCDFCRSRKTACRIDGRVPCRLCALHGRQCTFQEPAQPKSRPAHTLGGTASSPSLGTSQGDVPSNSFSVGGIGFGTAPSQSPQDRGMDFLASDSAPLPSNTSETSAADFACGDFGEQFFGDFQNAEAAFQSAFDYPVLADESSPASTRNAAESQSSPGGYLEDLHLDTTDRLHPQILGYTGDMDPYLLRSYQYDRSATFRFKQLSIQSTSRGSSPACFLLSQPAVFSWSRKEMGLRAAPESARAELEKLVSVDTSLRLITLFRRFILSQYPIFSETTFSEPRTSPPYLLAAIYMIAQPFAKHDDVLSIELAYEMLDSQSLFKIITDALQYEAHNPSLSLVQTLLLLIVRPSTNPLILESSLKWSYHGTMVTAAQNLGLHDDPASWQIASWQKALRRRLSCTIYGVDKWLACSLGRPPLLTKMNWLVTNLTEDDMHTSGIQASVWAEYLHYAQLGEQFGSVLDSLFSLRAVHELTKDFGKTLHISKGLLEQLSGWNRNRPSPNEENAEAAISLTTVSNLGYHYLQLTIFRAIVRPTLDRDVHSSSTSQKDDQQEIVRFARTGLRSATSASTTVIKDLQQQHFHMFWPHWSQVAFSSICFLQLLMATTSPEFEEAVSWFQDLQATRKEMRLKSDMLPVLRLGLLRIDALFWKRLHKVLHMRPVIQRAFHASSTGLAG